MSAIQRGDKEVLGSNLSSHSNRLLFPFPHSPAALQLTVAALRLSITALQLTITALQLTVPALRLLLYS